MLLARYSIKLFPSLFIRGLNIFIVIIFMYLIPYQPLFAFVFMLNFITRSFSRYFIQMQSLIKYQRDSTNELTIVARRQSNTILRYIRYQRYIGS